MSAPTHALSLKVLSLTKPKDKIYKTKNDDIKKILPQLYNSLLHLFSAIFFLGVLFADDVRLNDNVI